MKILRNVIIAVIALGFLAINLVFFQVDATEAAVVTQFGEPVRTITDPGLYTKLPDPLQSVVRINTQLQVYNLPRTEFLTSDRNNIVLEAYATWQVTESLLFLRTVRDTVNAQTRLADIINSEIGSALGQVELQQLVSTDTTQVMLSETLSTITEEAAARTSDFGFTVTDVRLRELTFPQANLTSVFQRMRSEREAIARQLRSEGTEQAAEIRANADADAAQILADANQQAAEIRGQADADAIAIYAAAFGLDPEFYQFSRTLQAYAAFIDQNTTLILPSDSPLLNYLNAAGSSFSLNPGVDDNQVELSPTEVAPAEPMLTPTPQGG
ncbi:MAG: protease modulator HflC [Anaerolineae bacterium]|nr:protease modulator HflC [Anaerolineae bacterium]